MLLGHICKKKPNKVITITILDIIRRPVFYLKRNVSETGYCLRPQMEPSPLDPIERA
jgi:hypothetical protein